MTNQPAAPQAAPDVGAVADTLRLSITRLARILRRQDLDALPPTLSSALHSISFDGPLTLGDLAALEHVAPPTITRVVDKLKAKGLVECVQDEHDHRVSRVRATPAGHRGVRGREQTQLPARATGTGFKERGIVRVHPKAEGI